MIGIRSLLPCLMMGVAALPAAAQERGRATDGTVTLLYWQAASTLNPYLSGIAKETEAASLVLEPLARFDETGALVPILAESIPTVENGGVSADLTQITWTLKPGVMWSDGTPLTAQDAVFTWQYCTDPTGGCAAQAMFAGIKDVTASDDRTVRITFDAPRPYPYTAFVSSEVPILQRAQFENCTGTRMSQCGDQNADPIGTGPFVVDDFRPNDVVTYSANPNFRDAAKPHFANVVIKGGGDPAASGRAVLETGEVDYGWNLQLAPDVLAQMQKGGAGEVITDFGSMVEYVYLNQTNPDPALGDARATVEGGAHPFLSDPRVGQAMSMAVDRAAIAEVLYGDAGRPTCNVVPAPAAYASDANDDCLAQDIDGANALLDQAGWTKGADGIRAKDGVRMKVLFQTSTNGVRQDEQALLKQWWSEIGIETELRNVAPSVFFGGDTASPDTRQKFFADVEMYTDNSKGQDPEAYLAHWTCDHMPTPANGWQGDNIQRFCDPAFDALAAKYRDAASLEDRGAIAKQMNDILVQSYSIIPLVHRGNVSGKATTLQGVKMNSWDAQIWNIADWYRVN